MIKIKNRKMTSLIHKIDLRKNQCRNRSYFLQSILIFLLAFNLYASDSGITIQTTQSTAYKHTQELTPAITNQLLNTDKTKINIVNSDNIESIQKVVNQLQDGDILVLAVHSNTEGFALGDKDFVEWENFWEKFGRTGDIPQLGGVIIQGCMSDKEPDGYKHVTESRLEEMRVAFNSTTLFTPVGLNPFITGINDVNGMLKSIYEGKKFADIDLQEKWTYTCDAQFNKNTVNIDDIRKTTDQYLIDKLKELDRLIDGSILGISDWYNGYTEEFKKRLSNLTTDVFEKINSAHFTKDRQEIISSEKIKRLLKEAKEDELMEEVPLPKYDKDENNKGKSKNVWKDMKSLSWDGES